MAKPNSKSINRTLGPVSDLEKHLPQDWWKSLFNSLYLKTDGDVIENDANTKGEINLLIKALDLTSKDRILDLCCGQGRHVIELAKRNFTHLTGIDRSRYLIRLARKRALESDFLIKFSEGDARKIAEPANSFDCVYSFGVLHHIPNVEKALSEIGRVLKSGGQVMTMLYNKDSLIYGYSIVYLRGIKEKQLEKLTMDELLAKYSERKEDNPYTRAYTKLEAQSLFSKYFESCSTEVRYNVIDLPGERKVKIGVPDRQELGWHLIVKGRKSSG